MPTQPYEPLLNRDFDKANIKELIDIASPMLQEAVNFATNLYERCRNSKKGSTDEAYPLLALYLHIIQLTDAVEVLISSSCAEPAKLLLRSAFEAKLGMEYIVETNSMTRATAWIVKNIIDAIEIAEKASSSHPKGKEYRQMFENAGLDQVMNMLPPFPNVPDDYISNLRASLEKPVYADVYEEYQRLAKKRSRVEWYSLYDGPHNIRELANHLNQGYLYYLYQSWSKMSHASDAIHLTLPLEDGKSVLGPIRNPLSMANVACSALGMLLEASQLMIKEYRSGDFKSFGRWWGKEIRDNHIKLVEMGIGGLEWYRKKFMREKSAD